MHTFCFFRIVTQIRNKMECVDTDDMHTIFSNSAPDKGFLETTYQGHKFQLIFDFSGKTFAISYYNGTNWDQRTIESFN